MNVAVDVENTGDLTAYEVVQLYIHQTYGTSSQLVHERKGFHWVSLAAHEKKTVQFALAAGDLTY